MYDGFGNLTQKTSSNAPALSMAVDPTTNRIQTNGAGYDANGNLTAYGTGGFAAVYAYDAENRLGSATVSGTTYGYAYDSSNQRVFSATLSGSSYTNELIYFYGADGEKLGIWSLTASTIQNASINQWFAGRLLKGQDRLQSVGKYFPYGEDRYTPNPANPANDAEKFATYTRDSVSGLDYAMNRYYNSVISRFMTADPDGHSASVYLPQSWNRYGYSQGDPVANYDPTGLSCENPEGVTTALMVNGTCIPESLFSLMLAGFTGAAQVGSSSRTPTPLSTNVMRSEWYKGLELAIKALKTKPNCAGLFGLTGPYRNSSPGPEAVLSRISNSYNFASLPNQPGPNGMVTVTSAETRGIGFQSIPIGNSATISVSKSVQITVNNVGGSFVSQGPSAWAVTILHELGHAYWDLYGTGTSKITPDGPNAPPGINGVTASEANTKLVQSKCNP
jgi:RHS repeat-associated protein